jgi:hypothetical protein
MSPITPPPADRKRWIAVLVARPRKKAILSPFFAKSDGLLVVDPGTHSHQFQRNPERTTEATCKLILASGTTRLVCGFIGKSDRDHLSAHGVDIRIGSCARSVDALVREFENLPAA